MRPLTLATLILSALGTLGSVYAIHHHYQEKARAALAQADTHRQLALEAVADANTSDAKALSLQADLKTQSNALATLRQEVDGLRAKLHLKPITPKQAPDPPPPPIDAPVPDLMPLVAKQEALIRAQDHKINTLEQQAVSLTLSRDHWREAAGQFQREAMQVRAALEAKQGSELTAKLTWGSIGFGLGIGAGALKGGF